MTRLTSTLLPRGIALAFLIGILYGCCVRSTAVAQDVGPTSLQLAYALDVARTAVNEASLGARVVDVRLIYEASRYHGRDDLTRLRWLRRHSACTNPLGDCNRDGTVDARDDAAALRRPGNAGWTRHLRWDDARPRNLRGPWDPERWERLRRIAMVLVLRDEPTGVCGVPVWTWGRASAFDARPGIVRIDCGAYNLGGATPQAVERARRRREQRALARVVSVR